MSDSNNSTSVTPPPQELRAPKGFDVSLEELREEYHRALRADSGKPNVHFTQYSSGGDFVSYEVIEETCEELKLLGVRLSRCSNESIQSVSANCLDGGSFCKYTTAKLTSRINGESESVTAFKSGKILSICHEPPGISLYREVTGIPAASIKAMQERIVFDGEIDRVEQEKIIGTIKTVCDTVRAQYRKER